MNPNFLQSLLQSLTEEELLALQQGVSLSTIETNRMMAASQIDQNNAVGLTSQNFSNVFPQQLNESSNSLTAQQRNALNFDANRLANDLALSTASGLSQSNNLSILGLETAAAQQAQAADILQLQNLRRELEMSQRLQQLQQLSQQHEQHQALLALRQYASGADNINVFQNPTRSDSFLPFIGTLNQQNLAVGNLSNEEIAIRASLLGQSQDNSRSFNFSIVDNTNRQGDAQQPATGGSRTFLASESSDLANSFGRSDLVQNAELIDNDRKRQASPSFVTVATEKLPETSKKKARASRSSSYPSSDQPVGDNSMAKQTAEMTIPLVLQASTSAATAEISTSQSSLTPSKRQTFPHTLHRLLMDMEEQNKTDVISFCNNGTAFCIHKPRDFLKDVSPLYFSYSKLASFKRQLQLYHFERIERSERPDGGGTYAHPLFLRDKPELLGDIVRDALPKHTSSITPLTILQSGKDGEDPTKDKQKNPDVQTEEDKSKK